jgi:hypothetical protein
MKKSAIEFLAFNDGVLRVFETDNDDEIISGSSKSYCYGNRSIGVKRFYAAYQNDIELDRVVHIHFLPDMTTQKAVVIDNTRYKVEQVQHFKDTKPRCTVLSLSQRGLYEGDIDDV